MISHIHRKSMFKQKNKPEISASEVPAIRASLRGLAARNDIILKSFYTDYLWLSVAQNPWKQPFQGLTILCQKWERSGALMVSKIAWLKQAEYDVFIPSKSKELTE